MKNSIDIVNKLMVEVFNDILKIEENALKAGVFKDLSTTEVHTIEAIGMYAKPTMSEVAKKLQITTGTLTVAINNLEKKSYVIRLRSEKDKRVIKLVLSKKGRLMYRMHKKFHDDLVKTSISQLNEEEIIVFSEALSKLHRYFLNYPKISNERI